MVNFGIDLGTTNSLIAKFDKGQVEVFKNPNGFKETLPSVIRFRNDRTLIGDQGRAYAEKNCKSVASHFKRKMGTTETIKIQSIKASKTPVELSALVLKELKTFVHTGEKVEAAVITIPASFDTVQSNATKEAGLAAGFRQVILLQEPIAASLAYANKKSVDLRTSQWMTYDLGGGTFDVALIKINEGELTVVDHEGNNYLGGSDFDALLVEKIVVPQIARRGKFSDLLTQLKSDKGKYNKLWYRLLHHAEECKIELSAKTSAEIDLGNINLTDDDGVPIDCHQVRVRGRHQGRHRRHRRDDAQNSDSKLAPALRPQICFDGGRFDLHSLRPKADRRTDGYSRQHVDRSHQRHCSWRRLFRRDQGIQGRRIREKAGVQQLIAPFSPRL
jgi:molecular chaperone DnaK